MPNTNKINIDYALPRTNANEVEKSTQVIDEVIAEYKQNNLKGQMLQPDIVN